MKTAKIRTDMQELSAINRELLEALKRILHNDTCNCDVCGIARTAIAKAEGR